MDTVTRDIISSFTKRKAEAICRAYQYLDKQPYVIDGITTGFIECVAVSPFDNVNKWYFLHEYTSCKHPVKALEFYKTIFFDVLLILKMDGEEDLSFEDIREYLQKRGESLPEELV
jgi:hypothetical protein